MESLVHLATYIRHGSDVILLFLSFHIFLKYSRPAGILIFYYSSTSLIFILSMYRQFGLGFISDAITRRPGEPFTAEMVALDLLFSISELALVAGVVLLILKIHSTKAVSNAL